MQSVYADCYGRFTDFTPATFSDRALSDAIADSLPSRIFQWARYFWLCSRWADGLSHRPEWAACVRLAHPLLFGHAATLTRINDESTRPNEMIQAAMSSNLS
jgi:hypothetical protein